ncbi:molybdopterin synthase catalytic subunit [Mycobacterium frederiksbergense]|uniref:Molybdopterin synthase catalytic subunit n=2 Tax=Mycolicibacterium frederiksbergense TaxID=117567 RepID=A0ABT6L5V0_9MYCO|nr:molybdopterin synthase catalytic subunit [Mycolicibacterium frederiksbergense]
MEGTTDERLREEETGPDERLREEETDLPMSAVVVRVELTDTPISLTEYEDLVAHQAAGAVVGFSGVVRDHDGGRSVIRLDYSAHPNAQQTLEEVAAEIAAQATGVRAIAVSHRIGTLQIGDAALVAAVAADHRRAAFETCARLVDTVKERLPVWKHQYFSDGTDEWVNSA